tara:strand:+ start:120 stop:818 length:699 start_codon:yes stop_codon:yes gene_type:complete
MRKLFTILVLSFTFTLSAQTRYFQALEFTTKHLHEQDALKMHFDEYYKDAKFNSGGVYLQRIWSGRDGSSHRIVFISDIDNPGRADEQGEYEWTAFVLKIQNYVKSWDKVYNGRVLSLQSSDSDSIDTFHIYDIIPSDPQAFKKAHDYFVEKSGKNIWKGKQVAFGTYDLGRPDGATHWILTSGENERDIVKTYDIIQSDYSKELVKYLQDRGDVKDLKDFTVRNLGSYFNN